MFARAKDFHLTRELGDELVILDERRQVAHQLDAQAAAVWRSCDGRSSADAIARSTAMDPSRVRELLAQLATLELVVADPADVLFAPGPGSDPVEDAKDGQTRRRVLGTMVKGGVGLTVGLPAITSVMLPTAAQAFTSVGSPGGESGHIASASGSSTPAGGPLAGGSSTVPTPAAASIRTPASAATSGHPSSRPHAAARRGSAARPTKASPASSSGGGGSGGGGSGGGGSGGGGSTGDGRVSQTLPFTGDDLVRQTLAGSALVAAGATVRLQLRARPPAESG